MDLKHTHTKKKKSYCLSIEFLRIPHSALILTSSFFSTSFKTLLAGQRRAKLYNLLSTNTSQKGSHTPLLNGSVHHGHPERTCPNKMKILPNAPCFNAQLGHVTLFSSHETLALIGFRLIYSRGKLIERS